MSDEASCCDEVTRLRLLVGPNERSYTDLRDQLAAAEAAVRSAEASNGELRGEIARLAVEVRRARQDQYHLAKLLGRPLRRLRARRLADGPDA